LGHARRNSGRLRFRLTSRNSTSEDDVAGLRHLVEVELGAAGFELREDGADARLDWGVVRAVAGDEFFDHRSECCGREKRVGDLHGGMLAERGEE
jgi:hypothetical protein